MAKKPSATPVYDNAYWIRQSEGKASGQYDDFVRNLGGGKDAPQLSKALNKPNLSDYYGLLYAKSNGVAGASEEYNRLLSSQPQAAPPPPPPLYGGWEPTPYTPFVPQYQSNYLPMNMAPQAPVPQGGFAGSMPSFNGLLGSSMPQGQMYQGSMPGDPNSNYASNPNQSYSSNVPRGSYTGSMPTLF